MSVCVCVCVCVFVSVCVCVCVSVCVCVGLCFLSKYGSLFLKQTLRHCTSG